MTTFENDLYKNLLSILVIRVHVGEYEIAVQEYKEFINKQDFSSSTEHECAYNLMTALIHGSNEELAKCTSQQTFTFLNNQIARLARRLTQFDNTKLPNFLAKGLKINEVLELDEEEDTDEKKHIQRMRKEKLIFKVNLNHIPNHQELNMDPRLNHHQTVKFNQLLNPVIKFNQFLNPVMN